MTIATTSNRAIWQGNGATTVFSFPFEIDSASQAALYLTQAGVTTPVAANAYQISGLGNPAGGTVTYPLAGGTPIAAATQLTLVRTLTLQQLTDLINQSNYYPQAVESALDYEMMCIQQIASEAALALTVPLEPTVADLVLPGAAARGNTLVGFDLNGNATIYPITASVGAGNLVAEGPFVAGTNFTPGVTTSLTLSQAYGSPANVQVHFDGTYQGTDQYTLSGTTITFSSPIPVGVNKVYIVGGTTLSLYVPPAGTVGDAQLSWGTILQRVVTSVAALAAMNVGVYQSAFVTGYYASGDGGGGQYQYNASMSQGLANGGTIIAAAGGVGCWVLQISGRVTAKQFGCRGNATRGTAGTGTDDTALAQTYLNWCNANGLTAYFPGAAYRFTATLNISNSGQTTFPQGRANIEGDGPQNTSFQWDNGNPSAGISCVGSVSGIAATSMQTFRGFSVIKADGLATGMYMQSHAHLLVENVWVLGWNKGFDYEDVQESVQINVVAEYNVIGLYASRVTFTLPNVLNFYNCTYGNNKQGGLDLVDPTTLNYDGGSIESNNDLTNPGVTNPIWGCRITLQSTTVNEATQCATFKGVYFERNGSATAGHGIGDIYLQNSVRDFGITLIGCNFNRASTYSTNCVGVSSTTSGGARAKVSILGCSFDAPALGGYPGPSSSRPYVQFYGTDSFAFVDLGNYYQSTVEAPNYSGSVAMPASLVCQQSSIGGSVRFNGTNGAIASSFGVASVTRTSTGVYTVNFANNQPSAGSRVYSVSLNGAGVGYLVSETAAGAVFQIENLAGSPTDFNNTMISWGADAPA